MKTNRRTWLLAVIGAPLVPPVMTKRVVADLAEQTLTTTWVTTQYGLKVKHTRTPFGVISSIEGGKR